MGSDQKDHLDPLFFSKTYGATAGDDGAAGGLCGELRGSPEFPCKVLECHLAVIAWDDLLV